MLRQGGIKRNVDFAGLWVILNCGPRGYVYVTTAGVVFW